MTDTQKVEKVKALIEEVRVLSEKLSEDELEQIAGGQWCYCLLGGGGTANGLDEICGCVGGGVGKTRNPNNEPGINSTGTRCVCTISGGGRDYSTV
ncbi:MAG: hypothetical protein LBL86_06745 [Coriobacteriales bacterium]|jgi:hypothetical protein|nr:hypothetical protein [Coriobacteriales bacterium]